LEHLLAKGTKGDLDLRLETAGGFLNAHTLRDATQFEITLPPDKLKLGLDALTETMQMRPIGADEIKREANVIAQEAALREPEDRMAGAAWMEAYGEDGLDAFGDLDVIQHATQSELAEIHHKMYVGSNLVVSVAGDVDVDKTTRMVTDMLSAIPKGSDPIDPSRGDAKTGTALFSGHGSAMAAAVPSVRNPRTAWALAAGMAVAASLPHSFFTYTPTTRNGLIVVGQTVDGDVSKCFQNADAASMMIHGRALVRAWVASQLGDPSSLASFRGMLLVQSAGLKPETILENVNTMSLDEFKRGLQAFSPERAVDVESSN
jgi:hypothetical protein